jgi:alpha-L-arabinofuranosidase
LAIEKSKGKYVSFLDTDDIWEKRKLEKQIQFLNNSKDFKIVFSNYYTFKDSEKVQIIKHKFNLPSGNITQNLLDYYSLGILTVLLEKSIFDQYKFNKNYNIIGDFEFFITLSQIFKIASIQEPLAYYRLHSSNYSSKKINMHIDELKNWMKKNENELRQKGFNINRQKFFLFKLKVKSFLRSFYKF